MVSELKKIYVIHRLYFLMKLSLTLLIIHVRLQNIFDSFFRIFLSSLDNKYIIRKKISSSTRRVCFLSSFRISSLSIYDNKFNTLDRGPTPHAAGLPGTSVLLYI